MHYDMAEWSGKLDAAGVDNGHEEARSVASGQWLKADGRGEMR